MNNCEKYTELISAYADGELAARDAAELEAHINTCENCASLLAVYRDIGNAVTGQEEAPAELLPNVMAAIRHEASEKTVENNRNKVLRHVFTRYLPIAACLAVFLFALPRMDSIFSGAKSSAPNDALTATSSGNVYGMPHDDLGGDTRNEPVPAPQMAPPGTYESGTINRGAESEEPPAEAPMVSAALAEAMPQEAADFEEDVAAQIPAPSIAPAATVAPGWVAAPGGSDTTEIVFEQYFATVTVIGDVPDILAEYDVLEAKDRGRFLFVPRAVAEELIAKGFEAEYFDENAEEAVIHCVPE